MATLHTPDIHPVETFDPINNHTVEFFLHRQPDSPQPGHRAGQRNLSDRIYDSVRTECGPTTYFREPPFLPEKLSNPHQGF